MTGFVTTVIVFGISLLLLCYWFHYMCRLILSAATVEDYGAQVARAYELSFRETQLRLRHGATELDYLKGMLDRDYDVLARLMNRESAAVVATERRMLAIDYALAALWYQASRNVSAFAARRALEEMSLVVAHFANAIGQAAAQSAAA